MLLRQPSSTPLILNNVITLSNIHAIIPIMNKCIFATSLLLLVFSNFTFAQTPQSEVSLDHVIVAVSDLGKAADTFIELGFTLKNGRLHRNGLNNKHIKFKDESSLELMTVQGEAKDDMAKAYQQFLNQGEGGIYVAFKAPFDLVMEKADKLGISYQVSFGDPFSYLTFEDEALRHVFFINYGISFSDPDSITTHRNNTQGIKSVWIQSSSVFIELLISLGADFKGILRTPDNKQNAVYRLNGYDYIIDESSDSNPRVMGILFDTTEIPTLEWLPPSSTHGIWVGFR
ncbi:MAG: VOC family protein [Balneola sp.]